MIYLTINRLPEDKELGDEWEHEEIRLVELDDIELLEDKLEHEEEEWEELHKLDDDSNKEDEDEEEEELQLHREYEEEQLWCELQDELWELLEEDEDDEL